MKRFWKKINRGLLLGGALLLALTVFVVVKNVQFKKEAPVIASRAREAVVSLLELNLAPRDAALSVPLSEASVREQKAGLEAHLKEYWEVTEGNYVTANDVRLSFDELLSADVETLFYSVDVEIPDSAMQVRSSGPDYAIVSFEMNRVSAVFKGSGERLFTGEYYAESSTLRDDSAWRGAYRGYAEMEMHRVDGIWRVCGISIYLNLSGSVQTELPTGGEE